MTNGTQQRKWTASAEDRPGPRQIKRVERAIGKVKWLAQSTYQITGLGKHLSTALFSGEPNEAIMALLEQVGDRYDWTLTRSNAAKVAKALEGLREQADALVPVVDKREEERKQREAYAPIAAKQAEEDKQRKQDAKAVALALLAKKPANATRLILAIYEEDTSDPMTDYHGSSRTRSVAIGWGTGSRESFPQLRAAAATFPETAHLGPGCDVWTVEAERAPDDSPHGYRGELLRGEDGMVARFTSEAEAREAVEALLAQAPEAQEGYVGAVGFAFHAARYGFRCLHESVEHREVYSMGRGNYLKAGSRYSTGWYVQSTSIPDPERGGWEVYEDALPDPDAAPAASTSNGVRVEGAEVQQHYHTKRGIDFWLVVPAERLSDSTFRTIRAACKARGGWYSRKWGKTPGGFAFTSEADAAAFLADYWGSKEDPDPEPPQPDDSEPGYTGDGFTRQTDEDEAEREATEREQAALDASASGEIDHGDDCPVCPPDDEGRPSCPPEDGCECEQRTDDDGRPLKPDRTTCGGCGRSWCDRCDPAHGPLCPWCHGRGYSTAPLPDLCSVCEQPFTTLSGGVEGCPVHGIREGQGAKAARLARLADERKASAPERAAERIAALGRMEAGDFITEAARIIAEETGGR